METIFSTLRKCLGIYAIALVIFGTFFSVLCCYISFKLRKTTTFIFICYMSLANIFTLYFWNLGNFLRELFQIDLINTSIWLCKFGSFFQFTSLQISAWILVIHFAVVFDENLTFFYEICKSLRQFPES